jgi:hypothetical protein
MKKVLLVLGVLFGVLGAAVFVGWFAFLRAPEPSEVCDNISSVMKKETGVVPKEFGSECVQRMQPPEFGRVPYAKQMKCLRDATSSKEISSCTDKG